MSFRAFADLPLQTLRRHAEAWHDFRWYGRVRRWDGLVVLVRQSVDNNLAAGNPFVFRGYLVGDKNFVGSWRSLADNTQALPLEGPFALSRVNRPPQTQTY